MASGKSNGLKFKLIIGCILLLMSYLAYKTTIGSNVTISADTYYFYVPESSAAETVADTLKKRGFLQSRLSFKAMAHFKELDRIKPGMYEIQKDWSNINLINHFKQHTPKATVFITLPPRQSRNSVIQTICRGTGIHPDDVWRLLNDKSFVKELGGFSKESVFCIFIPKNYRIYKNSTAEDLIKRLYQEYLLFWNSRRLSQAEDMGVKPHEVMILSSIVYSETKREEEMPIIAGVYINRIQKNMRLESDPTLLYAAKKTGVRRVFLKDKNISSPYNTYKNRGFPPGPIYIVPSSVIDKVLEYEGHDYLYFCANHDLSGGHLFAETFEEHKENAQKYHQRLDQEHIF